MSTYQSVVPNDKWPARYTFSPATRVGNLVFLSGTTGTDDNGIIVGPGDIVAQTRRIFEKFSLILEKRRRQSQQHRGDDRLRALAR